MVSAVTRRTFLRSAGAVTLGFAGLKSLFAQRGYATPVSDDISVGFGSLLRDPAGILDLPGGFHYNVFSRMGDTMDDGLLVPGDHDGMAAFAGPEGKTILVRNHELHAGEVIKSPFGAKHERINRVARELIYDYGSGKTPCFGGTTTLLYDTRNRRLERHHLSLVGTVNNCAGGPTPWNTWITCEETTLTRGDNFERDHGFNFEVPADIDAGLTKPLPLTAMGRFIHEAVAVDPISSVVYQTEDVFDGLIYRFIPSVPGRLLEGGRLQALAVRDRRGLDTRNWSERTVMRGEKLAVEWIDLDHVDSPEDDLRYRGFEKGAARFARAEGMWYGRDAVYFACTDGGRQRKGQIWRYVPGTADRARGDGGDAGRPGYLELFVEPDDPGLIDNADNLTVAPWGDLIVCEDGSGEQFLVGITPTGSIYKFARNALSESELAGATFSADGSTLFVNIQAEGLSLAITGPWKKRRA